jgi:hypothetical protein
MLELRSTRLKLIGSVGIFIFLFLALYRISQLPEPAPENMQVSGKQIIGDELEKMRESSFGRTPRGTILCDRVEKILDEGRIIFSSKLGGPRGVWHQSIIGKEKIYVKILEMNNAHFLHQLPYQMMEAIFHEAVHSVHGRFHRNSIEEECDAFVAGMTVEALIKGEEVPDVFSSMAKHWAVIFSLRMRIFREIPPIALSASLLRKSTVARV